MVRYEQWKRREARSMINIFQNTDVDDMIFGNTVTVPSDR